MSVVGIHVVASSRGAESRGVLQVLCEEALESPGSFRRAIEGLACELLPGVRCVTLSFVDCDGLTKALTTSSVQTALFAARAPEGELRTLQVTALEAACANQELFELGAALGQLGLTKESLMEFRRGLQSVEVSALLQSHQELQAFEHALAHVDRAQDAFKCIKRGWKSWFHQRKHLHRAHKQAQKLANRSEKFLTRHNGKFDKRSSAPQKLEQKPKADEPSVQERALMALLANDNLDVRTAARLAISRATAKAFSAEEDVSRAADALGALSLVPTRAAATSASGQCPSAGNLPLAAAAYSPRPALAPRPMLSAIVVGQAQFQCQPGLLVESDKLLPAPQLPEEWQADLRRFPSLQGCCSLGRLVPRALAADGAEVRAAVGVRLQNDGTRAWPPDTALALVRGPGWGVPELRLGEVPAGSCFELRLELTFFSSSAQQEQCAWALRSQQELFGQLLCLELSRA